VSGLPEATLIPPPVVADVPLIIEILRIVVGALAQISTPRRLFSPSSVVTPDWVANPSSHPPESVMPWSMVTTAVSLDVYVPYLIKIVSPGDATAIARWRVQDVAGVAQLFVVLPLGVTNQGPAP